MIFIQIIIFILALFILVKAADAFTDYSERIGLMFGLSPFIIGATIVAVGTSLPELVSSLYAVLSTGETTFVADSIVGSNIANALLILGIGAVVAKPLKVKSKLISNDIPFFFMSMALFVYIALDKMIVWTEGIFLLGFFVLFVLYTLKSTSDSTEAPDKSPEKIEAQEIKTEEIESTVEKKSKKVILKYTGLIILMMGAIAFGAKTFIDALLALSELFGVSSSLLTVSVVAIGTSLPEILTSINAIKRGNHAMAIGNVFGSNTFNIALVGSIPAFFTPLSINSQTFTLGIPFLIIATFVAVIVTLDNKVPKWEGYAMLLLYLMFLGKLFAIV